MIRTTVLLIGILLVFGTVQARAFLGFGDSREDVTARDGLVVLDASDLEKDAARHYRYREGDTEVRFFLVRDKHGTLRAAFDACEVCRDAGKGYTFEKGVMICDNCGQRFALNRIGAVTGGCNPHPLSFTSEGDTVRIGAADLLAGADYFPENKK